ncbi:MAG: helix-hairpin-helix domain-containing protein [Chloroflexi bacterium]|nr:helix-hairpin-helix domain-containing protein [Chloroflexota bacterium]
MPRVVNLVIIVAAIAAAAGAVVLFLQDGRDGGEPVRIVPPPTVPSETVLAKTESKAYVTGAVRHPGLYAIREGDRLADLIDLAGGITESADMQAVNLAVRVNDQDHWTVPTVGEPTIVPPNAASVEPTDGKVDINSADAQLLETLPGIGETRAQAIILHREEHGPFERVDDIVAVAGIGPSTLEGLRDLVEAR